MKVIIGKDDGTKIATPHIHTSSLLIPIYMYTYTKSLPFI